MVKAKSVLSGARSAIVAARIKHPVVTNVSMFSMRAFDADKDLPIVYCDNYNMQLYGLELFHQFDTKKYKKLARYLDYEFLDTQYSRVASLDEDGATGGVEVEKMMPRRLRFLRPNRPVNMAELKVHHSAKYLDEIHEDRSKLARITEVWLLNLVPWCLIEPRLLTPIKWQVSGTIFAVHLAMQHGWAINLGGGFHHARHDYGENFCFFSDVFIAIKYIWRKHPLQKFMIIDLDAHQATGLEHDLRQLTTKKRSMVYLLDMFNNSIQPTDTQADEAINLRIELGRFTGDATYLRKLDEALTVAFASFKPSMVIYIAGQDVLKHDQQGLMNITEHGLIKRDELVLKYTVAQNKCPIVMLLGGGYLARGVKVLSESIRHLYSSDLIWGGHKPGSRELTRPRREESEQAQPTAAPASSSVSDSSAPRSPVAAKRRTVTKSTASPQQQRQQQGQKKMTAGGGGGAKKVARMRPFSRPVSKTKRSVATNGNSASDKRSTVPVNAVSQSMSASDGGRRPAKVTRMEKTDTDPKAKEPQAQKRSDSDTPQLKKTQKGSNSSAAEIATSPTESLFSDIINEP